MRVPSLEKEMATLSRLPTWRVPWTEEPGGLQSIGGKESDTTEMTYQSTSSFFLFFFSLSLSLPLPSLLPSLPLCFFRLSAISFLFSL